jgi:hypothetical protein
MKPISEDWARTIGCITSAVTTLAIVVGGGWTLYQYLDNRKYQLETARFESIKPMYEQRLRLYIEVTSAAGIIASNKNEADVAKAREEFLKLYYGPIGLVEDGQVSFATRDFAACLADGPKCESQMTSLSTKLTRACAGSLQSGGLPPLSPIVTIKGQ